MRCSNCNSEVKSGDKKCPSCGATLVWKNKLNKDKKEPIAKGPISIPFIAITASAFFIFLLISTIMAKVYHAYNFVQTISITFIVFTSICIIAFFSLILVNRKVNKRRVKNFLIALGVVVALLIIFSTLFATSRNPYQSASGFFKEKYYENAIQYYQIVIDEHRNPEQVIESKVKIEESEDFLKEANEYIEKGGQYYSNNQFELALVEYEAAEKIYPYSSGLDKKIFDCNKKIDEQRIAEEKKEKEIEESLNDPPIADAGEDIQCNIGDVITLDGSNSTDSNGDKLSYIWNFHGDEFSGEMITLKVKRTGTYSVKLTVSDGKISNVDSLIVIVEDPEKEKIAEEVEDEIIEEPPEEEVAEELDDKFSFDEYINASKVREYEMIEEEDIRIKALGDKLSSEYTAEEFDKLPINYRMKCSITIPRDITEEELKSTFAQIIKDKSFEDSSIDEIIVFAWYFEESVGKTVAMGRAEWCPNGKWEELPPEIAESDIRDSYKIVFYIEIQEYEDELKYGLTESERMQAFYDLVVLQDSIPYDDPEWDEKNDESYEIIAEKYGITKSEMFAIGVEGSTNGWPMPEL